MLELKNKLGGAEGFYVGSSASQEVYQALTDLGFKSAEDQSSGE